MPRINQCDNVIKNPRQSGQASFGCVISLAAALRSSLQFLHHSLTMFARLRPSAVFGALVDVVAAPAVMQCLFHPSKIKLHSVAHVLLLEKKILLQHGGEKNVLVLSKVHLNSLLTQSCTFLHARIYCI